MADSPHSFGVFMAALAFVASVVVWMAGNYYIEDAKQQTLMMKACVESGGQWLKDWGPTHSCKKPSAIPGF